MGKIVEIIREELNGFDFLGNEERTDENKDLEILQKEEFQKQFIIDSLINRNKINADILESGAEKKDDVNDDQYSVHHNTNIKYEYDSQKEPMELQLEFVGLGNLDDELLADNIDVNLKSGSGEDIEFKAFDKAPKKIKSLFIRECLNELIHEIQSVGDSAEKIAYQ